MKQKLLAAAVALLSTAPAWAGNFYVLGAVGSSHADIKQSELDSELRDGGLTLLSSSTDNNDTGYKLQLGYQVNPWFAIEGGYVDLGKFNYSASVTGGGGSAEAKVDGWNLAVLGMMPLGQNLGLFAKLGTIDSKVKTTISASGTGGSVSVSDSAHRWRTNFGVGGTYQFTPNLGLRLEYEEFYKLGDKNRTGESDVSLFSLGLSYRF